MMAEPPKPERRIEAVALRYDAENDVAPIMVAKGRGLVAERIIALAKEHGIHIHNDPDLTGLLAQIDLNTAIPADLYAAVAQVLAFVYKLNKKI